MAKRNKSIKVIIIIIAAVYIFIGLLGIIGGADSQSKYYFYDNILIRVVGLLFILASIGLILRKPFARKMVIILNIISILEIILTIDIAKSTTVDMFSFLIIIFLFYVIPTVIFLLPRIKRYFSHQDRQYFDSYYEDFQYSIKKGYKHSKIGIASFIVAIINISVFILLPIVIRNNIIEHGYLNNIFFFTIIGFIFIFSIILISIGIGLGIGGIALKDRQKVFSIWGLTLNSILIFIYIVIVIFILIAVYNEIEFQYNIPNFI